MRLNFTHDDYRRLINELGGAGYEFLFFPEAEDRLGKRSQFALLRHDVDIDLEPASALAEVDARLNVNSTYFFMLRTSHYNVFGPAPVPWTGTDLSFKRSAGTVSSRS